MKTVTFDNVRDFNSELVAAPADHANNMTMLSDDGSIFYRCGDQWKRTGNEPDLVVEVVMSDQGVWCFDLWGKVYRWNEQSENSQWYENESVGTVSSSLRFESHWSNAQRLNNRRYLQKPGKCARGYMGTRIILSASLVVVLALAAFGLFRPSGLRNEMEASEEQQLNIAKTLLQQSYPATHMSGR